jgi:N-acetylglutamate synthase-like GNAT family acetyltransferase
MSPLIISQHAQTGIELISEIIRIKSLAWPYTVNQQRLWIEKNHGEDDIHVLLADNGNFVGYLSLTPLREMIVNSKCIEVAGVGNVCVETRGRGLGLKLLLSLNNYLVQKQQHGVLFCKENLVGFYENCGWIAISEDNLTVDLENKNAVMMAYNFNSMIETVTYMGKSF